MFKPYFFLFTGVALSAAALIAEARPEIGQEAFYQLNENGTISRVKAHLRTFNGREASYVVDYYQLNDAGKVVGYPQERLYFVEEFEAVHFEDVLAFCGKFRGEVVQITVQGKTYETCHITKRDNTFQYETWYGANIPFGIVKQNEKHKWAAHFIEKEFIGPTLPKISRRGEQ